MRARTLHRSGTVGARKIEQFNVWLIATSDGRERHKLGWLLLAGTTWLYRSKEFF